MKVYVLNYTWYMDDDGSGSYPLGIYSSLEKANEAADRYVVKYPLANGPDNEESLVICEHVLDEDEFE